MKRNVIDSMTNEAELSLGPPITADRLQARNFIDPMMNEKRSKQSSLVLVSASLLIERGKEMLLIP